nr:hypothetical protein [Photobacterium frigidiphilum]
MKMPFGKYSGLVLMNTYCDLPKNNSFLREGGITTMFSLQG